MVDLKIYLFLVSDKLYLFLLCNNFLTNRELNTESAEAEKLKQTE
jgi:hypothetical protein